VENPAALLREPRPAATGTPAPRQVVWVQAGHQAPGEPGYMAQTGAGSGPFGSEVGFTTRLAAAVERRLRTSGVDARHTPALVTPRASRGAVFISLHHDTPEGSARVGYAIAGAGENYYHGEGFGPASPTPYADSAPHRRPTIVSKRIEANSLLLAQDLAKRF